jgi:hypothetical protein
MALRCPLRDAHSAHGPRILSLHLCGYSALIWKNQLLRRDGIENFNELFTPLAVLLAVALLGVE